MFGRLLKRREAGPPPDLAPGGPVPVMARRGRPASATEAQVEALEASRFLPPAPLSRLADLSADEAAAILAALDYARAAIRQVTGEEAPTAIENEVLALLLADEKHAAHALRWVHGGRPLPLKDAAAFAAVRGVVARFWQPEVG
jgi:hypothetical protein